MLSQVYRHVSDRLYCIRELNAMTDADWRTVPVSYISVGNLVPTQGCLVIDRLVALVAGGSRKGEDPYGHVILYRGQLYIHDGHHDWALRWLQGEKYVPVRIKRIDSACEDPCNCHEG